MEVPGIVPASINCHACGQAIDLTGHEGFSHLECPDCGALSIVPVQFGNFLLLSTLGIGGMGTVYKALDLSLNRYLAVKILRRKLATSPEFIDNFAREARAAASVNHPNIAQVYSFGEIDGQFYLAMELLERGSLDDRLARLGKIAEKDVLEVAVQIAQGLRAAEQRHLLHRDIKPGNVLFNDDNIPKLVDFGLARPPAAAGQPAKDEPIWGTPYYVAPEKLFGQPEDVRSDIYSLGATLFHALAGRPPFEAKTAEGVVTKHATTPAASLQTYVPTLNPVTIRVIARMLAKNPAERHPSYDELIRDLHEAQTALKEAEAHTVIVAPTGERYSMLSVVSTLALVVLTVIVVLFVVLNRQKLFGPPAERTLTNTVVTTSATAQVAVTTNTAAIVTPPQTNAPPATGGSDIDFAEDADWARSWREAIQKLNTGKFTEALFVLETAQRQAHNHPARLRWLQYFAAVAKIAEDHAAEATQLLSEKARETPAKIHRPITVANFSLPLIAVLLDELPLDELETAVNEKIPRWATALATFTIGLKQLETGAFGRAATAFHQYEKLNATADAPQRWAYSLQPLAERLARDCDTVVLAGTKLTALQQEGKLTDALAVAQKASEKNRFALARAQFADQIPQLQKAIEEQKAKMESDQRDREEQLRQKAAAEVQKVAEFDLTLAPQWKIYDFKTALAKFTDFSTHLETSAGQQAAAQRLIGMKLLQEFKNQLSADFARRSYDSADLPTRSSTRVSGRLTRATDAQLIFATPYGELVSAWADLPPSTWVKLGDFYLATLGPLEKPETRARWLLQLAAFCKQYGMDRAAEVDGQKALQLLPAVHVELEALFPPPPKPTPTENTPTNAPAPAANQ